MFSDSGVWDVSWRLGWGYATVEGLGSSQAGCVMMLESWGFVGLVRLECSVVGGVCCDGEGCGVQRMKVREGQETRQTPRTCSLHHGDVTDNYIHTLTPLRHQSNVHGILIPVRKFQDMIHEPTATNTVETD